MCVCAFLIGSADDMGRSTTGREQIPGEKKKKRKEKRRERRADYISEICSNFRERNQKQRPFLHPDVAYIMISSNFRERNQE